MKTLTKAQYRDKVAGGWAGKMIGVMYGLPYEFQYVDSTYSGPVGWKPESIRGALVNDDLYVQLGFMDVMDTFGLDCDTKAYARELANARYELCHANRMARRNFWKGILPPQSGNPEFNMHADDIDFQIESDFIGFINPGMTRSAIKMSDSLGHIMCYGDGVYGGMFVSSMHSLAFFENDIENLVTQAVKCIPEGSQYAELIRWTLKLHKQYPENWHKAWELVTARYGKSDICVPNHSFNIDAKLNGAYVVIALLYGNGDFGKTLEIAAREGQDSDCNASTAAGVLGVIKGLSGIAPQWKSSLDSIANDTFTFTHYTFNKAVERSLIYTEYNIRRHGGLVNDSMLVIKTDQPGCDLKPEISFPGIHYSYQTKITEPSWSLHGNWTNFIIGRGDLDTFKCSVTSGDELTLKFKGKGILLQGYCHNTGGKADVYLDGKYIRAIDFYYREEAGIYLGNRAHLFHVLNLQDKNHVLRLVVRKDRNPMSKGNQVWVERAIIYN